MCRKTAPEMRWHKENYVSVEGVLRHPVDSDQWKGLDDKYPQFASDPRNVRLGLATDGFNPYGNMSTTYSVWPVIIFVYNVPPWRCMKEPYMMMSLLIPGPRSPGKDIDVYLQPLIEELEELWKSGVRTLDVVEGRTFRLHATLLWTINDFPAYGDISGWTTKGYKACPICNVDCSSGHSNSKFHYMGHRRFLPPRHRWRRDSASYDGTIEMRPPPRDFTREDIMEQLSRYEHVILGKMQERLCRRRNEDGTNWCKKSVLFRLPYWNELNIRHNLDVMHIEKNICDNLVGTIFGLKGKSKDTEKARRTLQEMGIRSELHMQERGGRMFKPPAAYTISTRQMREVCNLIKDVKMPNGYASNISSCLGADEVSLRGLKSHDCHVLLQRILPVVIRGFLDKRIYDVVCDVSRFFRELTAKELRVNLLESLEKTIILTLCKLEMIFPPAFFDIMIHLAIHLPREARMCGPVQYRWMYPVERYLGVLKGDLRNRARPEGSITESYVVRESIQFCSLYFENMDSRINRPHRQWDEPMEEASSSTFRVFAQPVRPLGACTISGLDDEINKMHWTVLNNCEEVQPFIREFEQELNARGARNVGGITCKHFAEWFRNKVTDVGSIDRHPTSDDLEALAWGPEIHRYNYKACVVNGVRYNTESKEIGLRSQNSGVYVIGAVSGQRITFYGVLTEVIQLNYVGSRRVFLFRCKWFDTNRDKPESIDGDLISINTARTWYDNDPYILADHALQVFYLKDPSKRSGDWKIVQRVLHRHIFNRGLFQSDSTEDGGSDEPPPTEDPMQQTIERPWTIPIDRIFVDLGNLARLPDPRDGSSGVGNDESDE